MQESTPTMLYFHSSSNAVKVHGSATELSVVFFPMSTYVTNSRPSYHTGKRFQNSHLFHDDDEVLLNSSILVNKSFSLDTI